METNLKYKSSIPAGKVFSIEKETFDSSDVEALNLAGVGMSESAIRYIAQNKESYGFDEAPQMQTTPSVATPVQFLQWWSPKFIQTVYAARKADEIMGVTNTGDWFSQEVVVPEEELLGSADLYGDYVNGNNSNFNINFNKRQIVRFMSTVSVGTLEQGMNARMRVNAKEKKMAATALALENQRNDVAFNGFSFGSNANYGLLNDPRLPAYGTLPVNKAGTSTKWEEKDYIEIVNDIRGVVRELEVKLKGNFSAAEDSWTLLLPMSASQTMTAVPQYNSYGFGGSVDAWFKGAYPKAKIVYVPQFDEALGGQSVLYAVVDEVNGDKNLDQFIAQRMFLVGFERRDTYIKETYSNATAGGFVGYGIGVVRKVGV